MGKYTVLENPIVDRLIDGHLSQIVSAITGQASPESIILYGSLARGEASVIVAGDQVLMLSDYELKVVGKSPRLRRLCARLSHQMTDRLGISTGIGWMHPRRLQTNQSSNLRLGPGIPSIFMYELKRSGRTLYGHDLLSSSPSINPDDIPLDSGTILVLNRMAESLEYVPCSASAEDMTRLDRLVWINKTILACAEALLLCAGRYHYSYQERGRRFSALALDPFAPLVARVPTMPGLVRQATEFKVRPDLKLYPDDPAAAWAEAAAMADFILRYLVEQQYGASFGSYVEFPAIYLSLSQDRRSTEAPNLRHLASSFGRRFVEGAKYLEKRRWPLRLLRSPYSPSLLVYALVPVLFQSCFVEERALLVRTVRQWLERVDRLEPPSPDPYIEWNYIRQALTWNWRVLCY